MKRWGAAKIRLISLAFLMSVLCSFELAWAGVRTCSGIFVDIQTSIKKTVHDLAALRLSVEQAQVEGSNTLGQTALANDLLRKENTLFDYVEENNLMTRQQVIELVKEEIQKIQKNKPNESRKEKEEENLRKRHEQALRDALIDGTRAIFHRMEPGTFKMGSPRKKTEVTIPKAFDMMATVTTQTIWDQVAQAYIQKYPKESSRLGTRTAIYKGPTRPMEHVSFEEIQEWLTALNKLSSAGHPLLKELISGHKKGDFYRLPTEAEWEFVSRGRGQHNDIYHFGKDKNLLGDYAWYAENSAKETSPVAQKKPLIVDGRRFYDMYGNVMQWTSDLYTKTADGHHYYVLRGGCYESEASVLQSHSRHTTIDSRSRFGVAGFRIVRDVR